MKKKYNTLIYIGRFQPFHKGHLSVVERALQEHKPDNFVFLVGSTNRTGTVKNPFSFNEVVDQIMRSIQHTPMGTIFDYHKLADYTYDDATWLSQVQQAITSYSPPNHNVAIIGHKKDESSYYLDKFNNVDVIEYDDVTGISGTDIREALYTNTYGASHFDTVNRFIHPNAHDTVLRQLATPQFEQVMDEYKDIVSYDPTKYDNTVLVTSDAVVHCDGHILVIERGQNPGKGKLALPGGFIDKGERVVDAIFRELKEETKIDVPIGKLRNSLKGIDYFDDVNRSLRARTITFAGFIDIRGEKCLPKIKGSDDATKAMWIPLEKFFVRATEFAEVHEDHGDIARVMINRYYR